MPFSLRPYRHFPVQCSVTHHAGPFQGQGTICSSVWPFRVIGLLRWTHDSTVEPLNQWSSFRGEGQSFADIEENRATYLKGTGFRVMG